jgi:heterodisulfide reductase subunit B
MFMDKWQYTLKAMENRTYGQYGQGIPVLTYEELAGIVMGYNPWDLGLQYHNVQSEPLLDKIGVEYDPGNKYLTKDGKVLPAPADLINV